MKKKYIKPEISEFFSLSGKGQYPEGACTSGYNADLCNAGNGAPVSPDTCRSGTDASLGCDSGINAGGSICDSGFNASGQTGWCATGTSPQLGCGDGQVPG